MVVVNTDAEVSVWISAVIASSRDDKTRAGIGCSAPRGSANREITKANAKSRSKNDPDAVNAVKDPRPTGPDHALLVSSQGSQETVCEQRVPGKRHSRPEVRVIRIVGIFSPRRIDRHIA